MNRLNLIELGWSAGTPLVLLHGFPLDLRIWADAAPRLAGRVVLVDLPGFGKSAGLRADSMAEISQVLHDTLEERGLLPCVLGGLSMGGYVTQEFVRRYRSDVRGVLLVDTKSVADDQAGRAGRDAMIELVRSAGSGAVADQMLPKVLGPTSHQTRPEAVRRAAEIMRSQSAAGIESALIAMRDRPDYTADLPNIDVPILIVVGDEDGIAPASIATGMGSVVPRSKVMAISGAGHFPPLESPEAFASAVNQWRESTAVV